MMIGRIQVDGVGDRAAYGGSNPKLGDGYGKGIPVNRVRGGKDYGSSGSEHGGQVNGDPATTYPKPYF